MNDLEARKKLLIAECEVYRQTLKLEIQNVRIYTARAASELKSPASYAPLLMAVVPMARTLFGSGKPKSRFARFSRLVFIGWRAYKQYGPLFQNLFSAPAPSKTAAEEFLEKRL